jgi:hypothetical protein
MIADIANLQQNPAMVLEFTAQLRLTAVFLAVSLIGIRLS